VAVLLTCLTATPAGATGEGDATGTGTIVIVEIRDAMGTPISVPPDGLDILRGTVGPDAGPDGAESGTGAVVYGGTATTSGTGVTTQVAVTSAVNATASSAGAADALETVSGFIQFINESGQAFEIDVRFDWGVTASATVMDAALETAAAPMADVEFSEASGGSTTSPCTGGLLVDYLLTAGPAPPNDTPANVGGSFDRTVILPDGETCAYNTLVQTAANAQAAAVMPTLPTLAAVLMALMLLVAAARWLGRSKPAV
jgi:hypothetical protein